MEVGRTGPSKTLEKIQKGMVEIMTNKEKLLRLADVMEELDVAFADGYDEDLHEYTEHLFCGHDLKIPMRRVYDAQSLRDIAGGLGDGE